ncbi:hypothetical protein [Streptomyces sp. NBC_01500]|uniref:hypothetical protein n=1 Tax=Streptomyces sp. NBC_01500 TaxID=2903886 RepID=UPI0022579DBB|nr:hypothetical protein [Streptomyces sp. NBC_01500]MCX4554265.1 hypothetical protein [Streptomyces sp. NBC_01500]
MALFLLPFDPFDDGRGLKTQPATPPRFFQRSPIVLLTACQNVVRPALAPEPELPDGFQPPFAAVFAPPAAAPGVVPGFGVLLTTGVDGLRFFHRSRSVFPTACGNVVRPLGFFGLVALLTTGVDGWRRFHRSLTVFPTACGSVVRPFLGRPFDAPEDPEAPENGERPPQPRPLTPPERPGPFDPGELVLRPPPPPDAPSRPGAVRPSPSAPPRPPPRRGAGPEEPGERGE